MRNIKKICLLTCVAAMAGALFINKEGNSNLNALSATNEASTTVVAVLGSTGEAYDISDGATGKFTLGSVLDLYTEYEYVYIPNTGAVEDYTGLDVEGKIALVDRGDLSFQAKLYNAANAGAVAIIISNYLDSDTGELVDPYQVINMSIDNYTIPAVSVTRAVGDVLKADEEKKLYFENGKGYTSLVVDNKKYDYSDNCVRAKIEVGIETGNYLLFHPIPNYGAAEDFIGIDVENSIALIADGGEVSQAEKLANAAEAGALYAIIYSDNDTPAEINVDEYPIHAIGVSKNCYDSFVVANQSEETAYFYFYDFVGKRIEFDAGELGYASEYTCYGGQINAQHLDDFEKEGYIVIGWKDASDNPIDFATATFEVSTKLTPIWEAHTHQIQKVDEKAHSCTENGNCEYYYCTECQEKGLNYYYLDAALTNRITPESVVDPAAHQLVHHDGAAVTCTTDGYKAYDTCELCDYTTYKVTMAASHLFKFKEAVAPNYENQINGYDLYVCDRCGAEEHRNEKSWENAKPADSEVSEPVSEEPKTSEDKPEEPSKKGCGGAAIPSTIGLIGVVGLLLSKKRK